MIKSKFTQILRAIDGEFPNKPAYIQGFIQLPENVIVSDTD